MVQGLRVRWYSDGLMIDHEEHEEWTACKVLAKNSNWKPSELIRLGLEVLETGCKTWKSCRTLIQLGQDEYDKRNRTVPFKKAAEDALACRTHLRPATLTMFRQVLRRMFRKSDLKNKSVRTITPAYCNRILASCFETPRQKRKGRSVLSVILAHSLKRGWCDRNEIEKVDVPYVREQTIHVLSVEHNITLLEVAKAMFHGEALCPVAIMMFAGIRPTELERLSWQHVNLQEKLISVPPTHSKTGGARHVSILPALESILIKHATYSPDKKIIPPSWRKKWRKLHHEFYKRTGVKWQPDVLRHGFASYYAAHFKDFARLQMEMGHSSAALLRTRYLAGVSSKNAAAFWAIKIDEGTI